MANPHKRPISRVTGNLAHGIHEDGADAGLAFLGRPQ
jgi:hypothetical protein